MLKMLVVEVKLCNHVIISLLVKKELLFSTLCNMCTVISGRL